MGRKKGFKHSKETKKKMSLTRLEMAEDGLLMKEETREKLSKALKGHKNSEEARRRMSKAISGRKLSKEHKRKLSEAHKGEKGSNWKGGVTPENKTIRRSIEYRLWREAVFARDNWTCQKYGVKGGKLHPHHIQNFSQYPELRFAIDNGITLSEEAHKEFHKKYGSTNNTREQLEEYRGKLN